MTDGGTSYFSRIAHFLCLNFPRSPRNEMNRSLKLAVCGE